MQVRCFLAVFICFIAGSVSAQTLLKGTVYENMTTNKLQNVFIRDKNTKQLALTDKNGNFEIATGAGHLLIFDSPGYVSDTLYVIDLTNKKIMLQPITIALREVNISSTRIQFDPHKEYPEVYQKSKVYIMSPSSWFSKEGKDARRLKQYFKHEAEERHIDAVFTRAYVGSIAPLKGQELEDFMTLYRPTYAFLMSNNSESLAVYINDSYKKYGALPPGKRVVTRLLDTSHVSLKR
ncbi:MAG TPA: hypothetical protein DCO83_11735 [Mucilaginibacter sp.]|jgi:hypothetical protein|nr:hypothetical protein [Mucilaginibacter sp.]